MRQDIYHRVVPNLADPVKLAANELITDTVAQGKALDDEIARLQSQLVAQAAE
jgi:hypothetical protein